MAPSPESLAYVTALQSAIAQSGLSPGVICVTRSDAGSFDVTVSVPVGSARRRLSPEQLEDARRLLECG